MKWPIKTWTNNDWTGQESDVINIYRDNPGSGYLI